MAMGAPPLSDVVVPQLARAARLPPGFARADAASRGLAELLDRLDMGAMLVTAEAVIVFANCSARRIVGCGDGLHSSGHQLMARRCGESGALHGAIRDACAGQAPRAFRVSREKRSPLTVMVLPDGMARTDASPPLALVFVRDPEDVPRIDRSMVALLFGLTQAEAGLALQIAGGKGLRAAAQGLGMSYGTARVHLAHVFQKTGVKHQGGLVQLVLQSLPGVMAR